MSTEAVALGVVAVESDDAFATLFYDHAARLVNFARMLGADDPEDVAQESFCKLYGARRRLDGRDDAYVTAYLNKIVVNEVRSRYRKRMTALKAPPHVFVSQESGDDPVVRRAVIDALDTLSVRKREALVLRYWADLPLAEIAEVMGVRLGTVKSLLSRGLDSLAAELGEQR